MNKLNIFPQSINQTKTTDERIYELDSIPILDLKNINFHSQIVTTFKQIGFCIVQNHGIQHSLIDKAFHHSKQFFMLPPAQKRKITFEPNLSRGYAGPGEEILDEENSANQKKETFDLGHPSSEQERKFYPQNLPSETISFMKVFYEKLFQVNIKIMEALEKGLGIKKGAIVDKCSDMLNQTLRLLYYPQLSFEEIQRSGKTRAGAHSDYGTITLLLQKPGKGQNGLRALNSNKKWVKVNPPDYGLVINLGDLFQHWSNDVLKSTIHKVEVDEETLRQLQEGSIQKSPERQTIVMFCHPNKNQILECLDGLGEPKYKPLNERQYTIGRVKATCPQKKP